MRGRTVILVSHHVQLCAPGARYIVALDNGRVSFSGDHDSFKASSVMAGLVQSSEVKSGEEGDVEEERAIEEQPSKSSSSSDLQSEPGSETSSTAVSSTVADSKSTEKKSPRKLIEEEKRAVGRIGKDIWKTYFLASGNWIYWVLFLLAFILAALSPVLENGWLRYGHPPLTLLEARMPLNIKNRIWSRSQQMGDTTRSPAYYVTIYALVSSHICFRHSANH